jgi:hypothetical protein
MKKIRETLNKPIPFEARRDGLEPIAARDYYEKELDSDKQEENNALGRLALHRL